jgi:hypothetical protein
MFVLTPTDEDRRVLTYLDGPERQPIPNAFVCSVHTHMSTAQAEASLRRLAASDLIAWIPEVRSADGVSEGFRIITNYGSSFLSELR